MTLLAGRRLGITDRLDALDEVLALARERVEPDLVTEIERVAGKAGDRLRFGPEHTVVALAGATGGGKSSLFNALAGESLSTVGLRRPTTGVAQAAVWGEQPADALLDWLEVPRRHRLATPDPGLDGLVLLDLPDIDSVQHRHRLAADRLVERVDLLIWVLDPQKYADAAVHERYLAALAGHAEVMLVVLNQVDRLSEVAAEGCRADLSRLLASEGLAAVPILPTSTRTGAGLDTLRAELARRVAAKRSSVRRLEADLVALADALEGSGSGVAGSGGAGGKAVKGAGGKAVGGAGGKAVGKAGGTARGLTGGKAGVVGRAQRQSLVLALSEAAGADLVAEAVAGAHRLRARRATGWPVTRWTARLRLDPARRLRLRDTPSDLVRTSLPGPSGVQRARVDSALRELAAQASDGLAEPWPTVVRRAATGSRSELPELLDRAVAGTDLGLGHPPRWWRAVGALQFLLVGAALAGLLWLLALFAVAWLQLPDPPLPHWGPLPVPTLLLAAGLVLGLLLAAISRGFARIGAARRGRRARRRLEERVQQLADEVVVEPVERELAAHTALRQALSRVRG